MVHSMTGFGKAEGQFENKKLTVEVRSLNSKGIDINLKLPGLYREKEMELRSLLAEKVKRGKVDASIYYESLEISKRVSIDTDLLEAYFGDLKSFTENHPEIEQTDWLSVLMKMPDVTRSEKPKLNPQEWEYIVSLIENAIQEFNDFRIQEGNSLYKDLNSRCESISSLLEQVISLTNDRIQTVRERITNSLKELKDGVDFNAERFEQEMIYYLEKLDINEEITRLTNHLEYFRKTLKNETNQGKKLGFIGQEIGREVNTIGSKSNHAEMQKLVVMMKDELEKIKEQTLNVL